MAQGGATGALSSRAGLAALARLACLPAIVILSSLAPEQLGRGRHDAFGLEAELALQLLERRRGAEGLHADDAALGPDIAIPSEDRGLLDGDARLHGGGAPLT